MDSDVIKANQRVYTTLAASSVPNDIKLYLKDKMDKGYQLFVFLSEKDILPFQPAELAVQEYGNDIKFCVKKSCNEKKVTTLDIIYKTLLSKKPSKTSNLHISFSFENQLNKYKLSDAADKPLHIKEDTLRIMCTPFLIPVNRNSKVKQIINPPLQCVNMIIGQDPKYVMFFLEKIPLSANPTSYEKYILLMNVAYLDLVYFEFEETELDLICPRQIVVTPPSMAPPASPRKIRSKSTPDASSITPSLVETRARSSTTGKRNSRQRRQSKPRRKQIHRRRTSVRRY